MADIIDQANEVAEIHLKAALSQRMLEGPRAKGQCHNCGYPLLEPYRWCNDDCKEDWEKRQR